ncbi:S-layer protein [Verrucomicrobiota bacterium]|nr:S-layer protein [Verrucomicrobiota bacterium]
MFLSPTPFICLPQILLYLWLVLCAVVAGPRGGVAAEQVAAGSGKAGLTVFPAELVLPVGATHRLAVTRTDGAGHEVDVTGAAELVASADAVAAGEGRGIVRAKGPGTASVRVRQGGSEAVVKIQVVPAPAVRSLSFVNDILPVLSRAGCNAGSCHAKPDGQAGFKLSVFAYDPKADYDFILKHARGRRVSPAAPEESLLLRKPTMDVQHGGGLRLQRESDAYRLLVEWINQGMPFGRTNDATLVGIEVFPRERRYHKDAVQPLLVRAKYSDGAVKDVTHLADFSSNDKEIAKVDEHGVVTIGRSSGQGVVIARFMGLVDVARLTVPTDRELPDALYAALPENNDIDRLVYAQLKKLGFAPSGTCTDAEFARRSSLDVTGQLPSPEQVRAFLADRDPARRERWIDRLLESPSYADHWAVKWADLLRGNPSRVGVKSVYVFDNWLRDSFRQNKPYDQMVGELLVAQGSTHKYGPTVFFRDRREPADVATIVSQIFLGIRMECAKCHHHPNEKWSQTDFFQLAAFFGDIKRKGQGISAPISGEAEFIYYGAGSAVKHPVTGEKLSPTPPDGPPAQLEEGRDPREAFVAWMRRPDNPHFSRAIVNRVWAELLGRGIVDPVDDFRASNPPSNEALLDFLARDFAGHGFDLKHLMRTILRSRVYQQSSVANENNLADLRNFSRSYRRRLAAEALSDAVFAVTGVADSFQGLPPGARAVETWNHKLDSDFLDAFGRPNSSAECPCERDTKASVVQVLHLMNSNKLQSRISATEGRAARLAGGKATEAEIIAELYLAAYGRFPTTEETRRAEVAFKGDGATRKTGTEDVMWSLINSAEFIFNH